MVSDFFSLSQTKNNRNEDHHGYNQDLLLFLSPAITYIFSWGLNFNNKLKCRLNPAFLFPSQGEYRRPENNVRKRWHLFLDLFVNGFPSSPPDKLLLKSMIKDCKTCSFLVVCFAFG